MVQFRFRYGYFKMDIPAEKVDFRKKYSLLPKDSAFNTLAMYNVDTGVVEVDKSAETKYARWACAREALNGNGQPFFDSAPKSFELGEQPARRKRVEYLLLNRVIPDGFKATYARKTIEFYETMLTLSAFDKDFPKEIVDSYMESKLWLEGWLHDHRFI